MLTQVPLDCTPEKLNKIEFTMEFWKHDAKVSRIFDHFLDEGLLYLEVRLVLHGSLAATRSGCRITFALAFASEPLSWYSSLCEDMSKTFGLIRVSWVIGCKDHGLYNFLAILFIPAIPEVGLTATRVHILQLATKASSSYAE